MARGDGWLALVSSVLVMAFVLGGPVQKAGAQVVAIGGSIQQPLIRDSQGNYLAYITITNNGDVSIPITEISVANATLGLGSVINLPPPITDLAQGTSALITLQFPPSSIPLTRGTAALRISGTYFTVDPPLSGVWSLAFRASGSGKTYYVDALQGSDANDCASLITPCATIAGADAKLLANTEQTVSVAPGTYQLGDFTTGTSGEGLGQPVRFICQTYQGCILAGNGDGAGWKVDGQYVQILGFDFEGEIKHGAAVLIANNYVDILGNIFDDYQNGNYCGPGTGYGVISDFPQSPFGPHIGGRIEGNTIVNAGSQYGHTCNIQHGMYLQFDGASASSPRVVQNNLIVHAAAAGIESHGTGCYTMFFNNTVDDARYGIQVSRGAQFNGCAITDFESMSNNAVVNSANGLNIYSSNCVDEFGTNWVVTNNFFATDPTDFLVNCGEMGATWSVPDKNPIDGTIAAAFNNEPVGGYTPVPGGPLAGAGTTVPFQLCPQSVICAAPLLDLNGQPRGFVNDIGAYEVGSSPTMWPWY